ncbi:MAG: hypothetical protein FWG84_01105 [Bacteroidales bacterium]|nr:hypothetical protein [Bacteroidales bacterium]
MAVPIRFAPVLEGNEAIEFYERWQKSLEEPVKRCLSKEVREDLEIFVNKQIINEFNNRL